MSIYHLSAGFVSRSSGRSCVQAAAYMARERLYETRRGITADYRNSGEVAYSVTLAPESATSWMRSLKVWDALEEFEDRFAHGHFKSESALERHLSTAQTAQTMVLALPRELSLELCQELVTEFAQTRFVSRGLVVTAAVHNDEGNPHAHLLISRRAFDTETGTFALKKDRVVVTKYELNNTRRLWAELTNSYLERQGIEARIDHRSYADQGLDLLPTYHRGWHASDLAAHGKDSRITLTNQEIEELNREKISAQPELILQELTLRQATFTKIDLSKLLQKRLGDDVALSRAIYESCLPEIVPVGEGVNGELRYTTKTYHALEEKALQDVAQLLTQPATLVTSQPTPHNLSPEQAQAVNLLCDNAQLSVLVGRAGSGKTTLLKEVVTAHKTAGYQVVGMSFSALAAEKLGNETGCETTTIAFYLDKWRRLERARERYWSLHPTSEHRFLENTMVELSQHALTARHLIIIDEAGMVGTKDWAAILQHITKSGAKLIVVGDDQQFKAVEAGDFFRKLKEQAGSHDRLATLNTILRQQESWMRETSLKLANSKVYEALADYEQHGLVQSGKREAIMAQLAADYIKAKEQQPFASQLILAYTKDQCHKLNEAVRAQLQASGWVDSKDYEINDKKFAVGEQIVLLRNHQELKNGTLARIVAIDVLPDRFNITATLADHTTIQFRTDEYQDFSHGYALTLHKSQGQTLDRTFILASKHMDASSTYVALTRHRYEASLYYSAEDFADFKALQKGLGKMNYKDLVIDYTNDHLTKEQSRVQDYVTIGQDLSTLAREKDWQTFTHLKQERMSLGKAILQDWESHKELIRQAGITKEPLEIFCKIKPRPLTRAEAAAYELAKTYQAKAMATRQLWQEIGKTHPDQTCVNHEKYHAFQELRRERNRLALELHSNPGLLSLAYQASPGELRVSRKAIEAQAEKHMTDEKGQIITDSPYKQSSSFTTPEQVKQQLQLQIKALTRELLGEPQRKSTREWRYGNKGSIAIFVAGTKQGLYANFETGIHGGALQMIQEKLSLDHKEAYQWALNWLGIAREIPQAPTRQPQQISGKQVNWSAVSPVPSNAPAPTMKPLKNGFQEKTRYAYHNQAEQLLGYVVRLENSQGDKMTLPLTYCQNPQGKAEWRWQGFGEQRPLYGLEQLAQSSHKPILIVEGEKTADAAQKLLPEYLVMTWQGGAQAVTKAEWSYLQDREVTIWPDNDEPGGKAAQKLSQILHNARIVNLPPELPAKWDLADPLPAGWNLAKVHDAVTNALPAIFCEPAKIQKVLAKHGINYPLSLPTPEYIGLIYRDLKQWEEVAGTKSPALLDKAILSSYLVTRAQSPWYYDSKDPLICALHAQQVGCIATNELMKQVAAKPDYHPNVSKLIDQAVATYHDQQKTIPSLTAAYQQQYPQASPANLALLAEQNLRYTRIQGEPLVPPLQQALLTAIEKTSNDKFLEHVQEPTLTKALTRNIITAHLINKELSFDSQLTQTKAQLQIHRNLWHQQSQQHELERNLQSSRGIKLDR